MCLTSIHLSIAAVLLNIWFVAFTDKRGSEPIPLSPRAVGQRTQWHIATDSLDYAVSAVYLDSIRQMGGVICHTSRWMNGATVRMPDSLADVVRQLSFIDTVELTRSDQVNPKNISLKKLSMGSSSANPSYASSKQQELYNLPPLHHAGFEGQNILIAIIDAGFSNFDKLTCFDKTHYMGCYDFSDNVDSLFGPTQVHGLCCLSTIAASDSNYHGSAVQADYYLMRSEENNKESRKEIDNMVAAIEKADSLGVNIISCSLGYKLFNDSNQNFSYADMNGRVTRASRAATIAARKGMLFCASAGNDGSDPWYYISAPADADSILAVGAVNTAGVLAPFSSRGPSADGRVKPEVCAVGNRTSLISSDGVIEWGNGTSYSCPLIAGLAACLWSALPEETNMQIRQRIIGSADRYNNPDGDYGYGIPDAWYAYSGQRTGVQTVSATLPNVVKVIRQGELLIRVGESYYTLWGQKKE